MGKWARGLDNGQEVWGRVKLGPQGTKKRCTSRKGPLSPKIWPLAQEQGLAHAFLPKISTKCALSPLRPSKEDISCLACQFCMWVGSRDCSLCPLQPCVLCFVGWMLRDGALLGGEASYLAKISLSFSLPWLSPLSTYYISLIYVL